MKKTYEKPVIETSVLNTEEITSNPLSAFLSVYSENTSRGWKTVQYY
ncbi:MAG: hypothetical protein LUH47_05490 [Clostridiales bacterium]|nr:hypothetical protein [Clostridiales bacterium]